MTTGRHPWLPLLITFFIKCLFDLVSLYVLLTPHMLYSHAYLFYMSSEEECCTHSHTHTFTCEPGNPLLSSWPNSNGTQKNLFFLFLLGYWFFSLSLLLYSPLQNNDAKNPGKKAAIMILSRQVTSCQSKRFFTSSSHSTINNLMWSTMWLLMRQWKRRNMFLNHINILLDKWDVIHNNLFHPFTSITACEKYICMRITQHTFFWRQGSVFKSFAK